MNTPYHLLNTTCTITTPGWATQSDGMDKEASAATQTSIPCRLDIDNTSQGVEYQRVAGRVYARLYVPALYSGAAVTAGKGATVSVGGVTWRVTGQAYHQGGRSDVLQTIIIEREN